MKSLNQVLAQLKAERSKAQAEVNKLDQAIAAIQRLGGKAVAKAGRRAGAGRKRKVKISAAGRARIAAAQRARWAKYKAAKK